MSLPYISHSFFDAVHSLYLFILLPITVLIMYGCASSPTPLYQKSDPALRSALSEQSPKQLTVLVKVQSFNEEVRNDFRDCGVTIIVHTQTIITLTGSEKELLCISEKPYVLGLELSKSNTVK